MVVEPSSSISWKSVRRIRTAIRLPRARRTAAPIRRPRAVRHRVRVARRSVAISKPCSTMCRRSLATCSNKWRGKGPMAVRGGHLALHQVPLQPPARRSAPPPVTAAPGQRQPPQPTIRERRPLAQASARTCKTSSPTWGRFSAIWALARKPVPRRRRLLPLRRTTRHRRRVRPVPRALAHYSTLRHRHDAVALVIQALSRQGFRLTSPEILQAFPDRRSF